MAIRITRLYGAIALIGLGGCADVLGLDQYTTGGGGATTSTGGTTTSTGGSTGGTTGGTSTGATGGSTTTMTECVAGAEEPCYDGPPLTEGIGECKGGLRTCDDDGQWGSCAGQQLPIVESCGTFSTDESCDDFAKCTGAFHWAKRANEVDAALDQIPRAIAADSQGNVIVVGDGYGAFELGGPDLMDHGGTDVFVVKLDREGKYVWSKRFGSAGADAAYGVAVDAADDVFIVGEFGADITFGGSLLLPKGDLDFFVARLDGATGDHVWSKPFGGTGLDSARAVAVDPDGDVVVGGFYSAVMNLGGMDLPSGGVDPEAFVAKLSGVDGAHLWSKGYPGAGPQKVVSVAAAPPGSATQDVVALFTSNGAMDLGEGLIAPPSPGGAEAFVARYDDGGNPLWSHPYGGPGDDFASAVAMGPDGAVVVTATSNGDFDFLGVSLAYEDSFDLCYWKIDVAGLTPWADRRNVGGWQYGQGVAIDAANNVLLTGQFSGVIDFGTPLTAVDANDRYIAKLGPDGLPIWSHRYLGGAGGVSYVAADRLGNIVFTNALFGTNNYGGGALSSPGPADADVLIGSLRP